MSDTKLPLKDDDVAVGKTIIPADTAAASLPLVTTGAVDLTKSTRLLLDIEQSARNSLERSASLINFNQPFLGGVVITDIQRSVRALTELATSPAITQAGKVVASIQQLTTNFATLAEPTIRLAEAAKIMTEPLDRLRNSVISLNKKYDFDLSIDAIGLYPSASPSPSFSPSPSPSPSPAFEVKAAVMVLKERLDNLADEITHKVEVKFQEQFDKFQKKSIIGSEAQEKLLYCKYCNTQLFRVRDFPAFILGIRTHKCTNKDCARALQIPGDLKIKDL